MSEPKTTEYCSKCGNSPEAGNHSLGKCKYERPLKDVCAECGEVKQVCCDIGGGNSACEDCCDGEHHEVGDEDNEPEVQVATPVFLHDGVEEYRKPLNAGEVAALREDVIEWASKEAWTYVCAVGCACDSVKVQYGPEGFEWITFVVGDQEFSWNPDDHVDTPDGELALAAALTRGKSQAKS